MGPVAWTLVVAGAALVVAGLAALRWGRLHAGEDPPEGAWRPSVPTRYVLGVSGLFGGYHLIAWGLPAGWLALRVPADRAWIVVLACLGMIAASVALDVWEAGRDA